jgi:hypothetical protein
MAECVGDLMKGANRNPYSVLLARRVCRSKYERRGEFSK